MDETPMIIHPHDEISSKMFEITFCYSNVKNITWSWNSQISFFLHKHVLKFRFCWFTQNFDNLDWSVIYLESWQFGLIIEEWLKEVNVSTIRVHTEELPCIGCRLLINNKEVGLVVWSAGILVWGEDCCNSCSNTLSLGDCFLVVQGRELWCEDISDDGDVNKCSSTKSRGASISGFNTQL